jgi:hypothetical protein
MMRTTLDRAACVIALVVLAMVAVTAQEHAAPPPAAAAPPAGAAARPPASQAHTTIDALAAVAARIGTRLEALEKENPSPRRSEPAPTRSGTRTAARPERALPVERVSLLWRATLDWPATVGGTVEQPPAPRIQLSWPRID